METLGHFIIRGMIKNLNESHAGKKQGPQPAADMILSSNT